MTPAGREIARARCAIIAQDSVSLLSPLFWLAWLLLSPIFFVVLLPFRIFRLLTSMGMYSMLYPMIAKKVMSGELEPRMREMDYGGDVHNLGQSSFNVDFECGRIPAAVALIEGAIESKRR